MSRAPAAKGRLTDAKDGVIVDQVAAANRLHSKGNMGTPQTGNSLRLSLVEAAYAMEMRRLRVPGLDLAGLLALGAEEGDRLEVHALAYRDLRARGLLVRHVAGDEDAYHVWERAASPKDPAWFRMVVASERAPVHIGALLDAVDVADQTVLAVVDEDGAVTHYTVAAEHPTGEVAIQVPDRPLEANLLDDRVLVADPADAAWLAARHRGTPFAEGRVLSLTEAAALEAAGGLRIHGELDLHARATERQHHFPRTFPVYRALQSAGVLAKSGFRFGTHLRGYRADPDTVHAEWLIQCAFTDDTLHWSEISRAIRLSHGVRKRFCIAATPSGSRDAGADVVRFLHLSWFRP